MVGLGCGYMWANFTGEKSRENVCLRPCFLFLLFLLLLLLLYCLLGLGRMGGGGGGGLEPQTGEDIAKKIT